MQASRLSDCGVVTGKCPKEQDVARSLVGLSVCLSVSVCSSHQRAVKKRLNRSRCSLGKRGRYGLKEGTIIAYIGVLDGGRYGGRDGRHLANTIEPPVFGGNAV